MPNDSPPSWGWPTSPNSEPLLVLEGGSHIGSALVTRALWVAVLGADPAFGAPEAGGAVERINLFDVVNFANELSRGAGREACYQVQCQSLPAEGTPRTLTPAELREASSRQRACPHDAPWCLAARACEATRTASPCGYRLPTPTEWAALTAPASHAVTPGPLAELTWPANAATVRSGDNVTVVGASWLSSSPQPMTGRVAPLRADLRAFNVGFRLVLDAP